MAAYWAPAVWRGMGAAALLVYPNGQSWPGGDLYVLPAQPPLVTPPVAGPSLADSSQANLSPQGVPAGSLSLAPDVPLPPLVQHVIQAQFSPDGHWLAVWTQELAVVSARPPASTGHAFSPEGASPEAASPEGGTPPGQGGPTVAAEGLVLWLVSVDGQQRQRVGGVDGVAGTWLRTTGSGANGTPRPTFLFADASGGLEQVQPGQAPQPVTLRRPAGAHVSALQPSPSEGQIAIDWVLPGPDGDFMKRFDQLVVWQPATGIQQTLYTAAPGDGLRLGPWTQDGQSLFFWRDPLHSGSLVADGMPLWQVDLSGHIREVATTLVQPGSVLPYGAHGAILQTGAGRQLLNTVKQVVLWDGQTLHPLWTSQGAEGGLVTQMWPSIRADGSAVAWVQGPVWTGKTTAGQARDWFQQLAVVVDHTGQQARVLKVPGGVNSRPYWSPDGKRLCFLQNQQLVCMAADGTGEVHTVWRGSGPADVSLLAVWP
ncbi:MAG: hypothetical protein K6T26_02025 [Alicyclobacillus sp.]|nr:hypothetical protein [Alicyclobacillus sp.]